MVCVTFSSSTWLISGFKYRRLLPENSNPSNYLRAGTIGEVAIPDFQPTFPRRSRIKSFKIPKLRTGSSTHNNGESIPEEENPVEDLRIPIHWLDPSKASEESEWLRLTLHKWLDDEYCPEETNIKISKVAGNSFYKSLMEKKTDLGEILLEMVQELSSISYQESFHGAFSSANAAVNLIIQRMQQD